MTTLPAGVILAGGESQRMGTGRKAFAGLAGTSLIEHVIRRFRAQVEPLMISVSSPGDEFKELGLALVADQVPRQRGPLAGLCSAMGHLRAHGGPAWLVLAPCDAPFMPLDLAARLVEAAKTSGRSLASVSYEGELQPTFSAWHRDIFDVVEPLVAEAGRPGLKRALSGLPHAVVEWPRQSVSPFFNVNTPDDLENAARLLDGQDASAS